MALNGAQVLHAGEFADIRQIQKLSPTGKGEDLFQIVMGIEDVFHIEVSPEVSEKITTVGEALELIRKAGEE